MGPLFDGGYEVDSGLRTLSQDTDFSSSQAEALCQQYVQRRVAGVFFAPLELPPDRATINQRLTSTLTAAGIPVVLLDRDVTEFPQRSSCDLVGIDNFSAGFILATHLVTRGARALHFLARACFPSTTDLRLAGCREALARHHLALPPDRVHITDPDAAALLQRIWATDRPDAFICSNDRTAAILMRTLGTLGLRCPEDVKVVGFDDVRYATLLNVPLTTMRQPCRDIGRTAVHAMLECLAHPDLPARHLQLPGELVVRQSSFP